MAKKVAKKEEGFFAGVSKERKKIQWPDKKTTFQYTLLVLVISIITAFIIYGLDKLFGSLLGLLLG